MIQSNVETFIGCESSFQEASVVLYGAPFDSTTSFRPGARFGPSAMRHESFGHKSERGNGIYISNSFHIPAVNRNRPEGRTGRDDIRSGYPEPVCRTGKDRSDGTEDTEQIWDHKCKGNGPEYL